MVVFYYCDQAVTHQMEKLNHLMNNNPDNLDRFGYSSYICRVTREMPSPFEVGLTGECS